MSKREKYEDRTQEILQPILDEAHYELVDVEYVKESGTWYLRAYIDKEGGITLNDCEKVSEALNTKLDEEDFIEDSYVLEISSPGQRPFKKERDYARNIGKTVEIRTYRSIDKQKEFHGTLTAYDDQTVMIESGEGSREFQRSDIALIRPYIGFDF